MDDSPSRRTALRWVGAALGAGLAGCTGAPEDPGSPTDSPDPTTTSPEPTTDTAVPTTRTTREPDGPDVHVGIQNRRAQDLSVGLTISAGDRVLHEATHDVSDGVSSLADGAGAAITEPGTYTVAVALPDGTTASYDWRVEGALGDLAVTLTDGGVEFTQSVQCAPDCPPVSQGGDAATLPYAVQSNEPTFTPGEVVVETDYGEAVALTLDIAHAGTTILSYTYDLTPDRRLELGPVVRTSGVYQVTVSTDEGATTSHKWDVPAADNYPLLWVGLDAEGEAVVGCGQPGTASVRVRNEADAERSIDLSLAREGEELTANAEAVPAGGETRIPVQYPVGDTYTLVATDEAGHQASTEVSFCYCYGDEPTVTAREGGLAVDSMLLVCE